MFYVLTIQDDFSPGTVFGPGSWEQCTKRIRRILHASNVKLTQSEQRVLEMDGFYCPQEKGGIYIIQVEPL